MTGKEKAAIVNKVEQILLNAQRIEKLHIGIYANADEITTIRYSVEELVVPVWEFDNDNDESEEKEE